MTVEALFWMVVMKAEFIAVRSLPRDCLRALQKPPVHVPEVPGRFNILDRREFRQGMASRRCGQTENEVEEGRPLNQGPCSNEPLVELLAEVNLLGDMIGTALEAVGQGLARMNSQMSGGPEGEIKGGALGIRGDVLGRF